MILRKPSTGAAAAARESVCILGSAERLGPKLNNMQDVELMDPECLGNGVIITSFGNAKVGIAEGRLVLRNQLSGSSIE